jgi:hypothetical protein
MDAEQVQLIYESITEGDREDIRALFDPSYVHHQVSIATAFYGFDNAFDGVRRLVQLWEVTWKAHHVMTFGDYVTSYITVNHGLRGQTFEVLHVFRFKAGLVCEGWAFFPAQLGAT